MKAAYRQAKPTDETVRHFSLTSNLEPQTPNLNREP